ncbi:hypothetical protein FWH09_02870 [Candidatus Saccharibacteria bacterium]|nr:hypothetical protein [Candidatus Saccharibacteria bacterium]
MIKRTKARRFLSISLAFVMMFAMMLPSTAFAAEQTVVVEVQEINFAVQDVEFSEQSAIVPFSNTFNLSTGWTTVLSKPPGSWSGGINGTAWISVAGLGVNDRIDVRLLDENWQQIWIGHNVISLSQSIMGNGWMGSNTFVCGNDVYVVQVRNSAIRGTVTASVW